MSSMSTVSVVVPTFNRADLINRALQSVVSQTYTLLDLIVVDDGSTAVSYTHLRAHET